MTLDEMLNAAEDYARQKMLGTKDELPATWMLHTEKGEGHVFVTPWPDARVKRLIIRSMKEIMREQGVVAYVFLSESWFSVLSREEVEARGPDLSTHTPPSERPDRREGVIAHAGAKDGSDGFRQWETKRDGEGRCIALDRLEPADELISLWGNLLSDRKPS